MTTTTKKRGYAPIIDEDRVINLYNSGLTQAEVGNVLGCSQASVSHILKRNAIPVSTRTIDWIEVKKLSEIMMSQSELANAVGCTQSHISRVLNPIQNSRVIRKRKNGRPIEIQPEKVLHLHKQGLSHSDIARELNCTQGYISTLLTKAGIKSGRKGPNIHAIDNAEIVIDYITTNGGSLRDVLEHLQLDVCAETIRRVAKKKGIPIHKYRYYQKTNGVWIVHKPDFKGHYPKKSDYLLPVSCTHCGYETELLHRKMFKEKPARCPQCGSV